VSLRQPTATGAVANPTPKLRLDQSSGNTLNSRVFTAMVWAYHTGGTSDAYQDIFAVRDNTIGGGASDDAIIGMGTHVPGSVRVLNIGDVDTDVDGVQTIPDNEWHHFTMVAEFTPDVGGQGRARVIGYVDGIEHARSDDTELTTPLFPDSDCVIVLFNSRSSDTDGGGVFVGSMAGLKIWSNVALTPAEIAAEMRSYMPVRTRDVWAVLPMIDKASAGYNYGVGGNFTVQGADFADGTLDPAGVAWDAPMTRRNPSSFYLPRTATLSGTALAGITEADIVAGGKTILIDLANDTWLAS
jgi:hypothetical protein